MSEGNDGLNDNYLIDQFMWGYQGHFRIGVQVRTKRALELVRAFLEPSVVLVGFADDDSAAKHPLCVEPEDAKLKAYHLSKVTAQAHAIHEHDPENAAFDSDPEVDRARRALRFRRARGTALAQAIEASGAMPGKRLFVSSSGRIDGFDVHTCIAVNRERLDALPLISEWSTYGLMTPPSFTQILIELILIEADIALGFPDPSVGAIRRSEEDLIQEAAKAFCSGCLYRTKNFDLSDPFSDLNAITAKAYERAGASGRLLFVMPNHADLETVSRLVEPVPMYSTRAVRKLLETTDAHLALLAHHGGVYGMGRYNGLEDAEDVFEIVVTSHATWEVRNRSKVHLRVAYGRATLPSETFNRHWATDILERTVKPDASSLAHVLTLITAAAGAGHGTTLVISAEASAEAQRLSGQATLLEPAELTPELLRRYAQIDGAILIDTTGTCHAIGVILDGHAGGQGDPARGSRYNSAIRYQASADPPTVVVVVSEDGDVSLIPPLRRRIHRHEVRDAVARLQHAHEEDKRAEVAEALNAIRSLSFYLTPEQCITVNKIGHRDEDKSLSSGAITLVFNDLTPNPTLTNDDFYE